MIERKAKILVVEDDQVNRKLFCSLLIEKGFHVLEASNGGEAIDLIKKEVPTLVLLDIFLPDIGGAEVMRICREKGLLNGAKVYALTGAGSEDILGAGFDGIIRKPIRVQDFLGTVEKTLKTGEAKGQP